MDTRLSFPAGLIQPEHSFRFSQDALLLAGLGNVFFPKAHRRVADLGCGSGAALFGLSLLRPLDGIGIDISNELICAAAANAELLGLSHARFIRADLRDRRSLLSLTASMDDVMANPPFYTSSEGRPSRDSLRNAALRDEDSNGGLLCAFCEQAARLLTHHGYFLCVYRANHIARLIRALGAARLGLRAIRAVAEKSGEQASRVFVLARKDAKDDCIVYPPLILRTDTGAWQPEALSVCPWFE